MAGPDIRHQMVVADIRLGEGNFICFQVSFAYFFAGGGKVYSQT